MQNGRTSSETVSNDIFDTDQTEPWKFICDNIHSAFVKNSGYVNPEEHYDKLKPHLKLWLDNKEKVEEDLRKNLENGYLFSDYTYMTVYEPKKRDIHYHSNWIDNVAELAILNYMLPIYERYYSLNAFGSIKGKGITNMLKYLARVVKYNPEAYYLQVDVKKFFAHIDKDILFKLFLKLVNDLNIIDFMYRTIYSFELPGIPIGTPLSLFNANLYLTEVDKMLEKNLLVIDFARNMDDIGIIVRNKKDAHEVRKLIEQMFSELKLEMKPNWRIAPVSYGIDMLGYVIYPTHIRIRKKIKEHMKKRHNLLVKGRVPKLVYKQQMGGFLGWCVHANSRNLLRSVIGPRLKYFKKMEILWLRDVKPQEKYFGLSKDRFVSIESLHQKDVYIVEAKEITVNGVNKLTIRFVFMSDITSDTKEEDLYKLSHYTITRSKVVMDRMNRDKDRIPFAATFDIGKYTSYY